MGWYLAPSLVQFRNEVNKKWPNRRKGSDGTLGDAAHASRASDHNPNSRQSVNAIDITYPGVNADTIINAVKKHPSANYVIFNRKIYTRSNGWKAEPYSGASPHTEHLHISILQTYKAEQDTTPWFTGATKPPKPVKKPAKKSTFPLPLSHSFGMKASSTVHNGRRNSEDELDVKKIQRKFKSVPDTGFYGPITTKAIRAWQIKHLMVPNGRVSKKEWDRLGL